MATQKQTAEVYAQLQANAADPVAPPDDDLPFDNAAGLVVLADVAARAAQLYPDVLPGQMSFDEVKEG